MAELTKNIFCAKEQIVTAHTGKVDANGELLFECTTPDCGRFLKVSADVDPATFDDIVANHEEQNKGQVSVEEQEKKLAAIMGGFADDKKDKEEVKETPTEAEAEVKE